MNLLDKINLLLDAKLNELKTVASSFDEPPSVNQLEQALRRLEVERHALIQQLGQRQSPPSPGSAEVNQLEQTLTALEAKLAQLKAEAHHHIETLDKVTTQADDVFEDEPEVAARKSRLMG